MKIVGIMAVYDEDDIIDEVVQYYISQGIYLVIIHNGSTNNIRSICKNYANRDLIRVYDHETSNFEWHILARIGYDIALTLSPDWIVILGADEFLESSMKDKTLKEAIAMTDSEGYNLIQFDRFEFFVTDVDDPSIKPVKERMKYYSYHGDLAYRAWKFQPGVNIEQGNSHYPIFPGGKNHRIYPIKFVMRHYPYRNVEQAKLKLESRLSRTQGTAGNKAMGRSSHYQRAVQNGFPLAVDHTILTRYDEDNDWNYEVTYIPYASKNPPRREDLFSEDGTFQKPILNVADLNLKIKELSDKIRNYKNY